jgi:acetyl esterase/lipase
MKTRDVESRNAGSNPALFLRPTFQESLFMHRSNPRSRRRLAFTSLLIAMSMLGTSAAEHARLPTGVVAGDMDLSPFYRWDARLPKRRGALLREEALPRQHDMDAAGVSLRILYTSRDVRWRSGAIPVSGTLYLPSGAAPPGGWPLLAWGHGTAGIADICAPSWTTHDTRDATYLNRWLEAGFAVVVTDYQGLGGPGPHPYLYWQAEARSILDSARAAFAARPKLISNRVLVAGQSQGAGAALGVAMLAREYAPDVHVLGIVATGPNSTFPDGPVALPVRNSSNMFLSFASGGLRDDGPKIDDIVSPRGRQLLDTARRACTDELGALAQSLKVRSLSDTLSISLEELAPHRIPVTDMPMRATNLPMLIATGMEDDTVEPLRQYAVVAALCADNDVTWRRYDGLDHDEALNGSFDDSLAFARSLLAGESVSGNCSEIAPPSSPVVQESPRH